MALAILLILLYHNKGALPEGLLKQAAGFCYVGVDIFFFASGVGCFFSYLRERDPVSFLRRRAERILPAYLPFILVWIVLQAAGGGITLPAALANLFGVQGFLALTPAFNWYVSGMWLSYALTPWLAPLAESCDRRWKAIAAVLALLLFSVAFWGDAQLIIMVTRLPVFLVGMLFAAESKRRGASHKGGACAAFGSRPGRRGAGPGESALFPRADVGLRPRLVSHAADGAGALRARRRRVGMAFTPAGGARGEPGARRARRRHL